MHSPASSAPKYSVAVRELCEFAAKAGDLDHRFTPSPSAQEGIVGHQIVANRRGAARRSEVFVRGDHKHLRVRGRIDGFDDAAGLLEEVKTYRGDLARMPTNHRALHWAQAKVYGALLCRELGLTRLTIALVYFEITRQEETVLTDTVDATELERFFIDLCDGFLDWAEQELAHRRCRNDCLAALEFPFESFRAGQRQLAENVFRAARHGRNLLVEAPTGIGKTAATLFPMLKACASEGLDKVFYLTAKGSGQPLASEVIARLRERNPGMALRVLELVAREKSCEQPGRACHADSCTLARGFYDRLPQARSAVVADGEFDRENVRRIARDHAVCPYYLTQELVRWCDVAIGDYSYWFDSTALLHLLTLANQWKVGVLVDEAHNLLERGRAMYGADLQPDSLDAAIRVAPSPLRQPLDRLRRAWRALAEDQADRYAVHDDIPESFTAVMQDVVSTLNTHVADAPVQVDGPLLQCYFDLAQFQKRAQGFGPHSMFDITLDEDAAPSRGLAELCIRNVVPAPFLKLRYAAARATVLFSATLSPRGFYADMLGLDASTAWLDVETPFRTEQLDVRLVTGISTRWAHRGASLEPIADVIAEQYARAPGNYLAFFSSFDYLERASRALAARHPSIPTWSQDRRMTSDSRSDFLNRFDVGSRGIGFAVLGGAFAEGIDLPGERLIGAFIATLGLPQVNPVNQEMRRRLESMFGAGYEYGYLYPGLRKVVQAAGRVIRTTSDRGTVTLIDERFARSDVRALLPTWWRPAVIGSAALQSREWPIARSNAGSTSAAPTAT